MTETKNPILTIGHSTHEWGRFLGLLQQHRVTAVADVRSSPHSRYSPQFSREPLEAALKRAGIAYVFLGRELGGRSEDPGCYAEGRVQYDRVALTAAFVSGIERVERGANEHRIALLCAEREPLDCHRALLVARALAARGHAVQHILADGRMEPHEETMDRLLAAHHLAQPDLFGASRESRIAEAVALQAGRVAYVREGKPIGEEGGSE